MSVDMADYRDRTLGAYEQMASDLAPGYELYISTVALAEARAFNSAIPPECTVLDLGCGTGVAAEYFVQQGHPTIASDLSPAMLAACASRGLRNLVRLDLEELPFANGKIDAVWAHTSLVHVPKERLTYALLELARVTAPQGRVFISVRRGNNQGYVGNGDAARWFSNYTESELARLVPRTLRLVSVTETQAAGGRVFLNFSLLRPGDETEQVRYPE